MTLPVSVASLLTIGILAGSASAQFSVVIPNGMATAEGNSSNAFPWGRGGGGLRHQCVYDGTHFTNQGITYPILITSLAWRANMNGALFNTNYPANCKVQLSTCPLDHAAVSATMTSNRGADLTTVFNGPVSWSAQPVQPGPAAFGIRIPLTTSFFYDPNAGDLDIECDLPIQAFTGVAPQLDMEQGFAAAQASRIYISFGYPGTGVGTVEPGHAVVVEVGYVPAPGSASVAGYGAGCHDRASATFYESFAAGTFDLADTSLALLPTGSGYVAVPTANAWFTPVAPNLFMADDAVSGAMPLGFTLSFPGGSTSHVWISSNGFVWAQGSTENGCCGGDPAALRAQGARWCPLWSDLAPSLGGTVTFDVDPVGNAAYVTFTNVNEAFAANLNTFQIAFFANHQVHYRFRSCTVAGHTTLTGWSPGNGTLDPGSVDVSASLPIVTYPDQLALALGASPRPLLGTNVVLTTTNVPTGSALGTFLFGLSRWDPGIELTSLGMPGCRQFVSTEAVVVFSPVGTAASMTFGVPNSSVFSGVHVGVQAAALAPGTNLTGIVTSNGIHLGIGTL